MDLFPGQIDADRVNIRPNSQKIESMEMDEDMIKANYQNGNGNGNGNGNTLPHVLTYSSDMSQQFVLWAFGSQYSRTFLKQFLIFSNNFLQIITFNKNNN